MDTHTQYIMTLTGDEELVISESEKQLAEQAMKDGASFVHLGKNFIKTSQIRSIIAINKPDYSPIKEKIAQDQLAWNRMCEQQAALSPEEKTKKELDIRILPGIKLCHGKIPTETMNTIYTTILSFFDTHPLYPRCPAKYWFPLLHLSLTNNTRGLYWFDLVGRNDDAIERWVAWKMKSATLHG